MKKFFQILVPSIIGSGLTIAVFLFSGFNDNNADNYIKQQEQIPVHNALYTVKENGEYIPLDFTGVSKEVMNSVVHISSTRRIQQPSQRYYEPNSPYSNPFGDEFFRFFWGEPAPGTQQDKDAEPLLQTATGSGVIISNKGYIVTNNHVIDMADEVEVTLPNNKSYKAKIIGTDPSTDLALLQIKADDLNALPLGNSDMVEVGEWVLAIGNPFNLNSTVTAGIISAKGRNINIINNTSAIEAFIQTDAAINPGNSGGALVDLNGQLIGINTAIASNTGSYTGYGFAIPSSIVSKVVEDFLKYGMVQRAYLGAMIRDIDSQLMKDKDLKISEGAYIDSLVEKSSASDAGILEGDVIVAIDNVPIDHSAEVLEQIGRHRPGDVVSVTVDRRGKERTFDVKLANQQGSSKLVSSDQQDIMDLLGATFEEIDKDYAEQLGIEGGVKVNDLHDGLLKKQTEISEGFIITGINHEKVKTVNDIRKILKNHRGGVLIEGIYENFPGVVYFALGIPD